MVGVDISQQAIDHAKAAKVPIIVAINKIDKPGAQPERIKQQLADRGLQAEDVLAEGRIAVPGHVVLSSTMSWPLRAYTRIGTGRLRPPMASMGGNDGAT